MSKFLKSLKGLTDWFEQQKRILPWRENPSIYRVWISEIMLQQTQVVTVVPFFERFIKRFPSVEILAQAKLDEVLTYWAGLGYYIRARNLHLAAKIIVQNKKYPKTTEEWLKIPGVGPYTAGAILSIAQGQPEPVLDGNVERVFCRIGKINVQNRVRLKKLLWRISKIYVETGFKNNLSPSILNQALMELGALICVPKTPKCGHCPVNRVCKARQTNEVEKYPIKKPQKKWIIVLENTYCILDQQNKVLLTQRQKGEWRSGLWDLPFERPPLQGLKFLGKVNTDHVVTHHKIKRTTEIYKLNTSLLKASENCFEKRRWEKFENLIGSKISKIPVGSALKKVLNQVHEYVFEVQTKHSGLEEELIG